MSKWSTFRNLIDAVLNEGLSTVAIIVLLGTGENWRICHLGIRLHLDVTANAARWGHQRVAVAL